MAEQHRYLKPISRCKTCGRAAAFELVVSSKRGQGRGRSGGWQTRNTPICGVCADALVPGASATEFAADGFEEASIPLAAE